MSYIKKLYAGRIGSLVYLVGNILSYGGFWLIGKSGKVILKNNFINVIQIILLLLLFIFIFSVFVRRLHDLGKSGWLTLLIFIPVVNAILGIILLFKPGNREANQYGPPPRGYRYLFKDLFVLGD